MKPLRTTPPVVACLTLLVLLALACPPPSASAPAAVLAPDHPEPVIQPPPLHPAAPGSSSITLYPTADAWIDQMFPNANHGGASGDTIVMVGSNECPGQEFPNRARGLFQFDLSALPFGASISSASFQAFTRYVRTPDSNPSAPLPIGLYQLTGNWSENLVTWNTQPAHSAAYDQVNVPAATLSWQTWDATQLVQGWKGGDFANNGLMLISGIESLAPPANCGARSFDDREVAGGNPAKLTIWYTASAPQVCSDLSIDAIEVTQAIQDNANSVPLVANKRTYGRAHVRSAGADCPNVLSYFQLMRGGVWSKPLVPDNPGGRITVRGSPNTDTLDNSFYVEIPPDQLNAGILSVCLSLNPDHSASEPSWANNWLCSTVTLADVPQARVHIYDVRFWDGSTPRAAGILDLYLLSSWLRRAYPVPDVQYDYRTLDWTGSKLPSAAGCGAVNNALAAQRALDGSPARYRYYGIVTDASGFMRGCAAGIPGYVASGPTGPGTFGWDFDGSYGDWYGGHELGHTYGRGHVNFCGASGGGSYPYPNGVIGGPATTPTRYRGFDVALRKVYPSTWTDVMSYCNSEWISDFTYNGIRDRLLAEGFGPLAGTAQPTVLPIEYLQLVGRANLSTGAAQLGTLYRRMMVSPEVPAGSGQWQIVLYNGSTVLGTWNFTPKADTEPADAGQAYDASIIEAVPWQSGTTKIAIVYQGQEVASRPVSAHAPQVQMIWPNGGENLTGSPVIVQWSGSDPDGDPVLYSVQYSPDAGNSWQTLITDYTLPWYLADLSVLPGSTQALFRVIASDGVNTSQAQSAGVFTVYNKGPLPLITSPGANACVTAGQQVMLTAEAYDFQDGPLPGSQLAWSADFQADLGTGRQLSVNFVPVGNHQVTLRATNSAGLTATANVAFTVSASPCSAAKTALYLPLVIR